MISLTTYNELSTKFAETQAEIAALREKLAAAEQHINYQAYTGAIDRATVATALAELRTSPSLTCPNPPRLKVQ